MRKDVLIIAIVAVGCATGFTTIGSAAETKPSDHCSFCDRWVPYAGRGIIFTSHDVFIVTRDSLALPGCSPAKARIVQQAFEKDYADDPSRPLPIRVLYELNEDPKCQRPMPELQNGSLVELYVEQPQFGIGSERMEVRIVAKMEQSYDPLTAPAKIGWDLIRRGYNPGDEGSGWGTLIVAGIQHRKADDKLNEEWRRLLGMAEGGKCLELIRRQRLWLKAIDKRCQEPRGAGPQWESAYSTLCVNRAFDKRIEEFRALRKCMTEKREPCPPLATDDTSVNNREVR